MQIAVQATRDAHEATLQVGRPHVLRRGRRRSSPPPEPSAPAPEEEGQALQLPPSETPVSPGQVA